MFTGIIEEIGTIKNITRHQTSVRFVIQAHKIVDDIKVDDSIAVNGACLTAVETGKDYFAVDAVTETLNKTTLLLLKQGSLVNLERALRLQDRLGGHLVQGHVDGIATIQQIMKSAEGGILTIQIPLNIVQYTIPKGSIAIDGVSLTIAEKKDDLLTVAIIPHTLKQTIFQYKNSGDKINIEVDFLAKYVEQFVNRADTKNKITLDWLKQQGFS